MCLFNLFGNSHTSNEKGKLEQFRKQTAERKLVQAKEVSRGEDNINNFIATAYTPYDEGCNGITVTGSTCTPFRTLAVDPEVIPLHSIVLIKSDYDSLSGYWIAEDIGGAIKGNRVDLCVNTKNKAFDFGERLIQLTIVKRGI